MHLQGNGELRGYVDQLSLAVVLASQSLKQMTESFGYQNKESLFYSVDSEMPGHVLSSGEPCSKL